MRTIVLATRSAGKIRELREMLAAAGYAVQTVDELGIVESPAEDALEVFETFEENARAKARHFAAMLPGHLVLAEDSGLVVDALGGAPGVRSKRWTGSTASGAALDAENNAALLRALAHVGSDAEARAARYVCVAVLQRDAQTWSAEGRVEGWIAVTARGSGGFGYDPYFVSAELGCTFAEASREEKARVSHRGRALRAVLEAAQEGRRKTDGGR